MSKLAKGQANQAVLVVVLIVVIVAAIGFVIYQIRGNSSSSGAPQQSNGQQVPALKVEGGTAPVAPANPTNQPQPLPGR